jgi:hypothetical protein
VIYILLIIVKIEMVKEERCEDNIKMDVKETCFGNLIQLNWHRSCPVVSIGVNSIISLGAETR